MITPEHDLSGPSSVTPAASPDPASGPHPRLLCEIDTALSAAASANSAVMVAWRMAEAGRQLDANLLNLPAGHIIETHTERDLDVLLVVTAGTGTLTSADTRTALRAGDLLWLPRGCTRALAAGPGGLAYLTVHQRRPGMHIRVGP